MAFLAEEDGPPFLHSYFACLASMLPFLSFKFGKRLIKKVTPKDSVFFMISTLGMLVGFYDWTYILVVNFSKVGFRETLLDINHEFLKKEDLDDDEDWFEEE